MTSSGGSPTRICIVTPTYNRAQQLERLHETLLAQTDRDFTWVVVDDESTDETVSLAQSWSDAGDLSIKVIAVIHGGKARAVNRALDQLPADAFALIVDSDEALYPDAIALVKQTVEKYAASPTVASVVFMHRRISSGELIANYTLDEDEVIGWPEYTRAGRHADGFLGYWTDRVGPTRFPEFEGETYLGPSVLKMLLANTHQVVLCPSVLGETDYYPDGLSAQGRALRLRNPLGMLARCVLFQDRRYGLWLRFKHSIAGYAYQRRAHLSRKVLRSKGIAVDRLVKAAWPFGEALAVYWRARHPAER